MADTDKTVAYGISADSSGFAKGMEDAASAAKGAAGNIESHFKKIGDAFGAVQKQLMVMAGLVAGGAFFKDAINASNQLTGETMKLSKMLGITGDEASTLSTALGDIGSSGDEYVETFTKFSRQLKSNEEGLKAMGLQTRDANGNLRDSNTLYNEALQTVGSYKAGLDQNTAAQTLFGKSIDTVMTLQKLNNKVLDEAREKNAALGLTITNDNVAASKAYKLAMNDVGDVLTAVKKTIGDAVMPVFTELAEYFASTGPYVVQVFKGAMLGLLVVFEVIKGAVKTVAGIVFEAFSLIVDGAGMVGDVFSKLFAGDFSGAYASAKAVGARVGQAFSGAFANFIDAGNDVDAAVKRTYARLYGPGSSAADAPKGGSKRMGDFGKTNGGGKDKADKEVSVMAYYEATLDVEKRLATERDALHDYSKAQELQFWQDILANAQTSGKDKIAITKKIAELEVQVMRESAKTRQALDNEVLANGEQVGMDAVAAARAEAQAKFELGEITKEQLLEQERQLEDQKTEIKRTYLLARLSMVDPDRDPVLYLQISNKIEELERQHQAALAKIKTELALDAKKNNPLENIFTGAQKGIETAISSIIQRTQTMRQALSSIWAATRAAVAGEIAKILAAKVMAFARERILALAEISTDAAKAGAGAAASQASIPIAGPMLALGAMAAVMAAVMGLGSKVPSARGGFDIPAGLNPLTQLHEREMVLPQAQADAVRDMAEGGGGGTVHIHAQGGDFIHKSDLARLLKKMNRNFEFV